MKKKLMSFIFISLFLILFLNLSVLALKNSLNKVISDTQFNDPTLLHTYTFEVFNSKYKLFSDGKIKISTNSGEKISGKLYDFKAEDDMSIERLYWITYKKSLFLFFRITNTESSYCFLSVINLENYKFNTIKMPISHFEPNLIENKYIYFAAFNFVGKFDLEKVKFVWQREDLNVDGFYKISFFEDKIIFYYKTGPVNGDEEKTLQLSKEKGTEI